VDILVERIHPARTVDPGFHLGLLQQWYHLCKIIFRLKNHLFQDEIVDLFGSQQFKHERYTDIRAGGHDGYVYFWADSGNGIEKINLVDLIFSLASLHLVGAKRMYSWRGSTTSMEMGVLVLAKPCRWRQPISPVPINAMLCVIFPMV
jgi:hypothetical protein